MNTPNLIIHNANVYTINPQMRHAQAVVVRGNQIVFVGNNRDALAMRTPHGPSHAGFRFLSGMPIIL